MPYTEYMNLLQRSNFSLALRGGDAGSSRCARVSFFLLCFSYVPLLFCSVMGGLICVRVRIRI